MTFSEFLGLAKHNPITTLMIVSISLVVSGVMSFLCFQILDVAVNGF